MKKWTKWAMFGIMILSLSACETQNKAEKEKEQQKTEEAQKTDEKKEQEKKEDSEANSNTENQEKEGEKVKQSLTVYYSNDNAEIESKQMEVDEITSENVWSAIISANPAISNVGVISCNVSDAEKRIDLNVSAELGEYLRGVGTTEETNVITAIVNTYLDAFGCDEIKILDNGSTLESNHKEYNNYLKKR